MIKGIDIGNHNVKDEIGNIISSRFTTREKIIDTSENALEYENNIYYINEGKYEINLDKASKKLNIPLLLALLSRNKCNNFKLVTGLPVGQFKARKDSYKNEILANRLYNFKLGGERKQIILEDALIFPEGAGAYYSLIDRPKNAIVIDIGGGTINICCFENGKLIDCSTVGKGTHFIYSKIKDHLNGQYSLDLKLENIEAILKEGLEVDEVKVDFRFIKSIIAEYVEILMDELKEKYPYRTFPIYLVGGGTQLVVGALSKIVTVNIIPNNLFANAIGFAKIGRLTWKDEG